MVSGVRTAADGRSAVHRYCDGRLGMLDAAAARRFVTATASDHLWPRWLFLRALGLIFISAFYSFALQIHGLIGEHGILPAVRYLADIAGAVPVPQRFWYAPSLLWIGAGDRALTLVVGGGLVFSLLLT